jgi:hypothetical protein
MLFRYKNKIILNLYLFEISRPLILLLILFWTHCFSFANLAKIKVLVNEWTERNDLYRLHWMWQWGRISNVPCYIKRHRTWNDNESSHTLTKSLQINRRAVPSCNKHLFRVCIPQKDVGVETGYKQSVVQLNAE